MKKSTKKLLKSIGITAGIVGGAGYITFQEIMNRNAVLAQKFGSLFVGASGIPEDNSVNEEKISWFYNQVLEEFEITNKKGFKLKAYLLPADAESDVYVFCSHGYRGNGRLEFQNMAKFYHDKGYNIFLVDHQAAGESDGKYIGFGYHEYKDCFAWLDFMRNKFGKDIQIILHGVSMGCATVTMMSGNDRLPSNVKFTVADCGYTSAKDEFMHNAAKIGPLAKPVLAAASKFNKLISGYEFKDANPVEAVKTARIPMLFIHGGIDDFVPTKMVYELYNNCNAPDKDILIVEGAAHAESYPVNSASYEEKINNFAEKYIK